MWIDTLSHQTRGGLSRAMSIKVVGHGRSPGSSGMDLLPDLGSTDSPSISRGLHHHNKSTSRYRSHAKDQLVSPPINRSERRHQDQKESVNAESESHTYPIATVPISHKMQIQNLLLGAVLRWTDLDLNEKLECTQIELHAVMFVRRCRNANLSLTFAEGVFWWSSPLEANGSVHQT